MNSPRRFARGRPPRQPGTMNKLEAAYAAELALRQAAGEVRSYAFEAVTLKLAKDCRLTPDFFVLMADDTIEFHEVKHGRRTKAADGTYRERFHCEDDALVKLKTAAASFPFRFLLVWTFAGKGPIVWNAEEF